MTTTSFDVQLVTALNEIEKTRHGEKATIKKEWAKRLNISLGTLERKLLKARGRKRPRRIDAGRKSKEIKRMVEAVWSVKKKVELMGEDKRVLATEDAIAYAEQMGFIEPGILSTETANRIAREIGFTSRRRCVRVEAAYANQVHVFDGSGSEHLFVLEERADGDHLLGVRASKEKKQKNRRVKKSTDYADDTDLKEERLLVYYYCAVDSYSRVAFMDVIVARGENAHDSAAALEKAWRPKVHNPLAGLPEILYTDNGPIGGGPMGWNMLAELGIKLETHLPYNAKAKARVERPWRTTWQRFELLYLLDKKREIGLFELREMLGRFIEKSNQRECPHILINGKSCTEAYAESLAAQEVRWLEEDVHPAELLASSWWATVDSYGNVRKDNAYYEIADCPHWMLGQRVECRRSVAGGVEAMNPKTLEWMSTESFEPVAWGDHRSFKHDVNDAAAKAAEGMPAPEKMLYEMINHGSTEGTEKRLVVGIQKGKQIQIRKKADEGFRNVEEGLLFFSEKLGRPLATLRSETIQKIKVFVEQNLNNKKAIEEVATAYQI